MRLLDRQSIHLGRRFDGSFDRRTPDRLGLEHWRTKGHCFGLEPRKEVQVVARLAVNVARIHAVVGLARTSLVKLFGAKHLGKGSSSKRYQDLDFLSSCSHTMHDASFAAHVVLAVAQAELGKQILVKVGRVLGVVGKHPGVHIEPLLYSRVECCVRTRRFAFDFVSSTLRAGLCVDRRRSGRWAFMLLLLLLLLLLLRLRLTI